LKTNNKEGIREHALSGTEAFQKGWVIVMDQDSYSIEPPSEQASEVIAQELVDRANQHMEERRDEEAITCFLHALDHASRELSSLIMSAMSLIFLRRDGLKESALWWAVSSVDADKSNAYSHYVLGLNYEYAGFWHFAIEAYKKSIRFNKGRLATLHLGICYRNSGDIENALKVFQSYISECADDAEALFEYGHTMHVAEGDIENGKATDIFRSALACVQDTQLEEKIRIYLRVITGDS